ncbi:MAG: transcriptional regulator, partial [Candidatus Bathyarchaeota archaeon]
MISLDGENGITVESVLKEAGFAVSQRCCSRPSCFDYAARREGKLVFVKVQDDIGNISRCDAIELKALSERMSAASLLLSEKAREKPLEDDTVYSRYGIIAVTLKTFEDIVLHKTYPLILAGPGGYFVDIDGEAIKERRQHLGLSVGELSEMMGTS